MLVHDGVRPFVKKEHVFDCWQKRKKQDAAVLAVPVKDTIKIVDAAGNEFNLHRIDEACGRSKRRKLFGFLFYRKRMNRLLQDDFMGTDDAMLVERIGTTVHVVEGDYYNIKITTPEDLPWAEWILHNVRGEGQL